MFGANPGGGGGGNRPHLEFRAGRCTYESNRVTPDPRRGTVTLSTSPDGLLSLTWRERATGNVLDESFLFPGAASFERVSKVTDGRVILLRFQGSSARKFFWMQEPDAAHDDDLVERLNTVVTDPPRPGVGAGGVYGGGAAGGDGGGGGGAGGGVDSDELTGLSAIQNMMARGGPQDRQEAEVFERLLTNLHGAAGNDSSIDGPAAEGAGNNGSGDNDGTTNDGNDGNANDGSDGNANDGNANDGNANDGNADGGGADPSPLVDPQGLQRLLAGLSGGAAAAAGPSLGDVLTADDTAHVFDSDEVCDALLPLLPEPDRSKDAAKELLRSPQFKQALGSLTGAVNNGDAAAVLANFGLAEGVNELQTADGGPVERFLRAIQAHVDKSKASADGNGAGDDGNKMDED